MQMIINSHSHSKYTRQRRLRLTNQLRQQIKRIWANQRRPLYWYVSKPIDGNNGGTDGGING